ncbi:MAG: amino acid ABC transporter substrate-binding protein [Caldilineaceae bacterium]|nr:amino acid ABC transporter substrate-binding protein [Caldilineaceae bacterium]
MTRRARIWTAAAVAAGVVLLLGWFVSIQGAGRPGGLLARLLLRQDQTWEAMAARGSWRVGLDPSFPPFELLDGNGQPAGYDVDLARRMAAAWGLEAEIVPIGFDSLLDALRAGRIDGVVSALPYDPRATRDYAYSPPYFEAGVRLAVRAGSPLTSTQSLAGQRVAVEWGSMGDMVGRRLQRAGVALELVPFETPAEATAALEADPTLAALLIDQVSLREAQGRGAALVAAGPVLESNAYVIAMPRQAATLHERVAAALAQFQADGTLAELEARWFGPLSEE